MSMDFIRKKLEGIIRRVFGVETEVEVTLAPEAFSGDFATNVAMKIAGEVNRKLREEEGFAEKFKGVFEGKANPREVAEVLRREFLKTEGDKLPEFEVEVAGAGFLNFTPRDEFYLRFIEDIGENLENFRKKISPDEYKGKMVVCEFSDPNPFKVLHVGHLYTSVVGDAISRLIEEGGGRVVRVNFGGDVGLHVAKTIYMLSLAFTIDDIAKAYVQGTRKYEEDEEAKREITRLNKMIYKIAELGEGNEAGLDEEERKVAEIYWRGRELSYQYFKDFYREIGVKFDKFYPESTVAGMGLKKVLEEKERGVYSESDGAVVFRGEEFGLHTRVFVNKEGLPTYEAKDVGLLFAKWADYKFDESVVITGNDIIDYMKVVLKSVEQYAPELVKRTTHITHGNVRLPGNEKMSSRKGNFVKAVAVLELVKSTLAASSASADDFNKIALGAIKYFFLRYKIGGNIVFDAEESVSLNGNSGPYLQYSVVRGRKILLACSPSSTDALLTRRMSNTSRSATPVSSDNIATKTSYKMNKYERSLNKKFVQYPEVLRGAIREKAPHLLANYLFELAQEFSRFYENCPVLGSEVEAERKKFVQVFTKMMEHGLGILGIDVPDEM